MNAPPMKLLRTVRLDASDTFVFANPAEPGEWAVSGAFAFWHRDPMELQGKERAAFRSGFLGVSSLGRSTLAQIVQAMKIQREELVSLLARQLVSHFDAPDVETARRAAEDEVTFVESLCTPPCDTLIAVHRSFDEGEFQEIFRTLHRHEGEISARAFSFLEVEGEDEVPAKEPINLVTIAQGKRE